VQVTPDVLSAADRNFVGAFAKLVEHQPDGEVGWFGPVVAFATRLPLAVLNQLMVLERADLADVDAAADWLGGTRVPHEAVLRRDIGEEIADHLVGRGFERRAWVEPVMALRPPPATPVPAAGVSVRAVEDERVLEQFVRATIDAGDAEPIVRGMYVPSFVLDPDVRLLVSALDGKPVGSAIAIRTGDTAGVYAVETRPAARRRGVGTAVTWAAVDAGRAWGCSMVVLQSSDMGFGVYSAMGFEVVDRLILMRGPAIGGG
jgi:GNAT superfamily N-acetyltransferase